MINRDKGNRTSPIRKLDYEILEPRKLLATVTWSASTGGDWNTGSNWDSGSVPAAGDDVIVPDLSGDQTIRFSSGNTNIASLTSQEYIEITGGTFVAQTVDSHGLELRGGILRGVVINSSTELGLKGGTLDGVTINGDFVVGEGDHSIVEVENGLTLNGTATLGGTTNHFGVLRFFGDQTLDGTGEVIFGNGASNNSILQWTENATLTIGSGITVSGNRGSIGYNSGIGGPSNVNVLNQGNIGSGVGGLVTIRAANLNSPGELFASLNSELVIAADVENGAVPLSLTGEGTIDLSQTIRNSTVVLGSEVMFDPSGGTLDGVTINGDFVVGEGDHGIVEIENGLTLNGTATLGGTTNHFGVLRFFGDQTLDGTGEVIFGNGASNNSILQWTENATLTIGSGITVSGNRGSIGYNSGIGGSASVNVVNQGTIQWDSGSQFQIGSSFENAGTIDLRRTEPLTLSGDSVVSDGGFIYVSPNSKLIFVGSFTGNTIAASNFLIEGEIEFAGGSAVEPRLLETMSLDQGVGGLDTSGNFYYDRLRLADNSYVRLVDESDNSAGDTGEVLYVGSLIVPANSTLDLNALTVYARLSQVDGTIVGGTVTAIPDSGPLDYSATTPGTIFEVGETDEWTFFGREGQSVGIVINPTLSGARPPLAPGVDRAEFDLIDPENVVIATGSNGANGGIIFQNEIELTTNGTYRLQIRAASGFSSNTGNYNVTLHDVTPDVETTSIGATSNGEIEHSFSIDRWNFAAIAGQQIRFDLLGANGDVRFRLDGPNGFEGFSNQSGDSDLITLPFTGNYEITVTGNQGSTGQYSFSLVETTVTELSLGDPFQSSHVGAGSAQLYRLSTTEANPMIVRINDLNDDNRNTVYVRRGLPPTKAEFDFQSQAAASADQIVLIANASPGDWYILVYGNHVPVESEYSIEVVASSMFLTEATPDRFGADSTVDVTINGAGFVVGATLGLVDSDDQVLATASNVQIDSYAQITGTFDLTGVAEGNYGLRVSIPDGTVDTLSNAFEVLPAGEANLETRLIMPGALGRHAVATIYVEYANTGTVAMAAPLLRLQSADPDGSDRPILTLDQSLVSQGFWTDGLPDGFSESIQILASGETPGLLNPGESVQVPVYYTGLLRPWNFSDTQVEMELRIFDSENEDEIPWDTMGDDLQPRTISDEAWNVVYANLQTNVGDTWGDFVGMLSDNAKYLNRLGRSVIDVAELWSFELQQAIGFGPITTLASTVDASIVTNGADLSFGRSWSLDIDSRFSQSLFGRGWSVPWQSTLAVEENGVISIYGDDGGLQRRFVPDNRFSNRYFSLAGDTGRLNSLGGGVFEINEQDGSTTRFTTDGKIDFTEDSNNNRITMGYNGSGQLESLTHSSGPAINIAYNSSGLIESLTDSANRTTTFEYDTGNEYLIRVAGYDGISTNYTYDQTVGQSQHALQSIETGGVTQVFRYDTQGRLDETGTLLNVGETATIDFGYGTTGRVSVSDLGGGTTNLFYDERGLLTKVGDPFGNVTTTEYGADYRIREIVDPLGQTQQFTWSESGALTSTTDQLGHTTTFTHEYVGPGDTIQRMTSFTDANKNTTRYEYDSAGNLTATIYADESVERTTEYDANGNPLTYVNRRQQIMSYQYNAVGQVTRQTFDDGTFNDFEYDNRGNLTRILEPGDRFTIYEYDNGDRLEKVTYPEARFLEYTYDSGGRRQSMTDHTGYRTNYLYDVAGRLTQLTNTNDELIVEYLYDPAGRLEVKNNGNGTYTNYEYDLAGQVLSILNRGSDDSMNSSHQYAYDSLGRRTSMATIDGIWHYKYDSVDQLVQSSFAPATGSQANDLDFKYVYDAVGNRIETSDGSVATSYSTNNLNQYTSVGPVSYTYDLDGNLISRSTGSERVTHRYDQLNRLVGISSSQNIFEFVYNADGERIEVITQSESTKFLVDPVGVGDVVAEFSENGMFKRRHIYGRGFVGTGDGQGQRFFDYDAIGNAVGTTNEFGEYLSFDSLGPYGETISEANASTNGFARLFGSTAENSMIFLSARYYDPQLGRFVSADPLRLGGGDYNTYRFVQNSPTNYSDPTGLIVKQLFPQFFRGGSGAMKFFGGDCDEHGYARLAGFIAGGAIGKVGGERFGNAFGAHGGALAGAAVGSVVPVVGTAVGAAVGALAGWVYGGKAGGVVGGILGGAAGTAIGDYAGEGLCGDEPDDDAPAPLPPANQGANGDAATTASQDPNQLLGPNGFGDPNFVASTLTFPYRIEFENYGPGSIELDGTPASPDRWATAPAQRVDITNELPELLDLETFALTGFGFGDFIIPIPSGHQSHSEVVSMTYLGQTFDVIFSADLNREARALDISFQSIDPTTELPPEVLVGFLPPEDGTGSGQGFVTYTVRPTADLPSGTEIRNIAEIQFDRQTIIATDQVDPLDPSQGIDPDKQALVTIDAGTPTSAIDALPPTTNASTVTLAWSGEDDENGSGIGSYELYVSTNGGDFEKAFANITDPTFEFPGEPGNNYRFYVLAIDNVGQRQSTIPTDFAETDFVASDSIINGDLEADGDYSGLDDASNVPGWNAFPDENGDRIMDVVSRQIGNLIKLDSRPGHFDRIYQDLATEAGQTYVIQFDVFAKGDGTDRADELRVFWDGQVVGTFRGIRRWQTVAVEVVGTGDPRTRLEFRETFSAEGGDGDGPFIDNVSITPVQALPFENGGFEEGSRSPDTAHTYITDIPGWHTDGAPTTRYASIRPYSNVGSNGSYYWNLDSSFRHDRLFHGVETQADKSYILLFDMRTPSQSLETSNQVRIRWNGKSVAGVVANSAFQTFAVTLNGEKDGTSWLDIREAYDPANPTGDGIGPWVDNIRIYEIGSGNLPESFKWEPEFSNSNAIAKGKVIAETAQASLATPGVYQLAGLNDVYSTNEKFQANFADNPLRFDSYRNSEMTTSLSLVSGSTDSTSHQTETKDRYFSKFEFDEEGDSSDWNQLDTELVEFDTSI